jgi:hypothetical protein
MEKKLLCKGMEDCPAYKSLKNIKLPNSNKLGNLGKKLANSFGEFVISNEDKKYSCEVLNFLKAGHVDYQKVDDCSKIESLNNQKEILNYFKGKKK